MVIKLDEQGKPTGGAILEQNFKQLFPNVSFPAILFPSDVEAFGYGMYDFTQVPQTLGRYEKAVEVEPIRDAGGYWRQQWAVVQQTPEEQLETDSRKQDEVRAQRSRLLMLCDWTQLDDAPVTNTEKAAWASYRQALRDVPSQPGFPWDVVWPQKP